MEGGHFRYKAQRDFEQARRQALFEDLLNLIRHRDRYPVPYEEIRRGLREYSEVNLGTQMVPLDKIVGSVGRYRDFTRSFLPRRDQMRQRWKSLDVALHQLHSWPPIELYKIGDRYIIRDGHHRVSVARANDLPEIEAEVIEIRPPTALDLDRPLTPQLLDYERRRFFSRLGVDFGAFCPGVVLEVTEVGGYESLFEHIQVHRWYIGEALGREVTVEEAVEDWCQDIYRPLVRLISRLGILDDFPERTPTDLYLWLTQHMHYLRQEYGDELPAEVAAEDFHDRFSEVSYRQLFKDLARAAQVLLPN